MIHTVEEALKIFFDKSKSHGDFMVYISQAPRRHLLEIFACVSHSFKLEQFSDTIDDKLLTKMLDTALRWHRLEPRAKRWQKGR